MPVVGLRSLPNKVGTFIQVFDENRPIRPKQRRLSVFRPDQQASVGAEEDVGCREIDFEDFLFLLAGLPIVSKYGSSVIT